VSKGFVRILLASALGTSLVSTGCVSGQNAADPGVIQASDGSYRVAATSGVHSYGAMPIFSSSDLSNWTRTGAVFAPGSLPSWTDHSAGAPGYWAPQIYYFSANGEHKYEAFYSGFKASTQHRCIGRAYSADINAFTDDGNPLCVSNGSYSVIDPSIFYDSGQHYLLYKDDLSSEQGPKRIVIRTINDHGALSSVGPVHYLITPTQAWETSGGQPEDCDGPPETDGWASVEAPTMIKKNGTYYLFYSGNAACSDKYGIGVAKSSSPTGGFVKYGKNPILSGRGNSYCGVGGQDVTNDGSILWYHAYKEQTTDGGRCHGDRFLGGQALKWDSSSGWPYLDGGP
jgi:arabinan endo-1,5-alpha-L-arabinosidase